MQAKNVELKRANEILKAAASFFVAEPDRPHTLTAFIDVYKDRFGGVEPICRVLAEHDCKIAPTIYYAHRKRQAAPAARTVREVERKNPDQRGVRGQLPRLRGEEDLA
ncbi:hypothetical protein [Streptomyces sp. NPDC003635]